MIRTRPFRSRGSIVLVLAFAFASLLAAPATIRHLADALETLVSSRRLPDLSGLVWTGANLFLTVHDTKNQDDHERPRVRLMALPTSLQAESVAIRAYGEERGILIGTDDEN